jgi:hypothetical protein
VAKTQTGKQVVFDMSNRRNEIPKMLDILDSHKDWKSLTFFQYKGGNGDLVKPLTRIRISRRSKHLRADYIVTIGVPNYAEREYVTKFTSGGDGIWPDDFFQLFPKKKALSK